MALHRTVLILSLACLAACSGRRVVNKSDFMSLRPGMSYDQAVARVGKPGTKLAPGQRLEGVSIPTRNEAVYFWMNADGSSRSVAVRGGHIVSVAEWAL